MHGDYRKKFSRELLEDSVVGSLWQRSSGGSNGIGFLTIINIDANREFNR
jgi:hypothetical protein